jgi:ionotropic glutamate receptor NMDA 2B
LIQIIVFPDYHGWIDIKDIVWPGNALKPPEGIPEKRFIRVTFLEEDPYVMLGPPASCSGNLTSPNPT